MSSANPSFRLLEPETSPPEGTVLDACRDFVNAAHWTYARTMPQWPHEYALRHRVRAQGIEAEFDELARCIDRYGFRGQFGRAQRHYLNVDEWRYWKMEPYLVLPISVINRAHREPESAQLRLEMEGDR